MRHEYVEALSAGRNRKARWILVRSRLAFFYAIFAYAVAAIAKTVKRFWMLAG
jgi:hypothetical protein